MGQTNWTAFFDLTSLLITVGGTLAITFLSYSRDQFRELGWSLYALFFAERQSLDSLIEELKRLARLYRLEGPRGLESQEKSVGDPFLQRTITLLVDLQKEEEIQEKLAREMFLSSRQHESARQILTMMSKLLPAFGLIGTLVGLVLLLRQLTVHDPQNLTIALSVAVLTTLYGALLANMAVLPLAARLQSVRLERDAMMRLILEWALSLARGETAAMVEHRLTAFLPSAGYGQATDGVWDRMLLSPRR